MLVNACAPVVRPAPATQERSWRTYLGSERRSPASADTLNPDPQPVWRVRVARGVVGAPALTEALVVLAQSDRQLAVLDRATGEVLWRRRLPGTLGAGPLTHAGRVYAATQETRGRLYSLHLETGRTEWSLAVGDVAAPLVLDDTVLYAGSTAGLVIAVAARSGRRLWQARVAGAVRTVPLPAPTGLVVATAADSLFLLDRRSGAVLRRRALAGSALAAPALADSQVLIGTTGGELAAVRATDLTTVWRHAVPGGVFGSVAVRDEAAWALSARGDLWRVPLADPGSATAVPTGMVCRAGPTPVPSGVLLAGVDGEVALFDAASGRRTWSARLRAPVEHPPLVDGRTIVAVSARGEVVTFR